MSDTGRELAPPADKSLREIAMTERLEFYREASITAYPDIRAHILKEVELDAEHRRLEEALASAHRRKQEARLAPSVALAVCILAFVAAAGIATYLHIALKLPLMSGIAEICFSAAFVISATALLLSKVLRPAEYLEMLRHAKGWLRKNEQKPDAE